MPNTNLHVPEIVGNPVPVLRELWKGELENANHHSINDDGSWPGKTIAEMFRALRAYYQGDFGLGNLIVEDLWYDYVKRDIRYLEDEDEDVIAQRLDWYSGR